nr:arf-GAP with coiled-coil, ANK repeat and PH domain-containing protein 2-like [Salvelinus alpinus]
MKGRGPLHHATYLGHTGQVCLFLKRGACQTEVDEEGHDPLSMAVQAANADIVTLLRLARMNEEMREAEGPLGQPGVAMETSRKVKRKDSVRDRVTQHITSFGSSRSWRPTSPRS